MRKIYLVFIVILLSAKTIVADSDRVEYGSSFDSYSEREQNKIRRSKVFRLAFFCHELTVEEVKAALKDINMEDLLYKRIGLRMTRVHGGCGGVWEPTPNDILDMRKGYTCSNTEGCLYLREQIGKYCQAKEEAEKRAYKQAREAYEKRAIDRYNSTISELKNDLKNPPQKNDSIFY